MNRQEKSPPGTESPRILRLLHIIQELRNTPAQSLEQLLRTLGISRSQFYKDREALAALGFRFDYRKCSGFQIVEDRLTPLTDLSLSDRVTLLFALEHLSACGDGLLAAKAVEVGRKLVGGLPSPFREQLLQCFDTEVTEKAYGILPKVYTALTRAIAEGRRLKMLYCRSADWTERWRTVDPRRIYMRQRTLYLYARTVDDVPPAWKVFRLSRIRDIKPTGLCLPPSTREDDGFQERMKHAFMTFLGEEAHHVRVRFSRHVAPYIREKHWHDSQQLEETPDGGIILSLDVAEPMEVIRWSRQFGKDATVLEGEEDER
ncbi:WYL domain-containing protein [uncultured Desulfovibrio sp.]|uniref:helix-turn-helix transcriptional regulator n=1 Tax=uncultured Desulfovibrio sp. TaxID=167968 RepID=UPI002614DC06|nr:WYL domain-containing protein [uncultured Desulfovibrio sp.]